MNILETIIEHKALFIEDKKTSVSIASLKKSPLFSRQPLSLKQFLLDDTKTSIIAEFKRKSPSIGIINNKADVVEITTAYTKYGASGLSVLTDNNFFGGCDGDLIKARVNQIPILRKDFIIDEYQLIEAKSIGADVILLIAVCLSPPRVKDLAIFAQQLGLETILEIHCEEELGHICNEIDIIGVNNRDLKTFTLDINRSIGLSKKIPTDKIKIAESGINNIKTIRIFKEAGFKGFLIGENFMKEPDPTIAFAHFVENLKSTAT